MWYVQEQVAAPIWWEAGSPQEARPVVVYTRQREHLDAGPYHLLHSYAQAWQAAMHDRARGCDVRWKAALKLHLCGRLSAEDIQRHVARCWYFHHELIISDRQRAAPLLLEAARRFGVAHTVIGRERRSRAGADAGRYQRIIGGSLAQWIALSADRIISYGETPATKAARRLPGRMVEVRKDVP